MKAFLCYEKPFTSFKSNAMWLQEERPDESNVFDSVEVELPREELKQIWEDEMEPAAVEAVFQRLWEEKGTRQTK